MYLVEQSGLSAAALPISDLRAHLRLGTGFADDAVQDPVLEWSLRAAMAQIEAATGKALLKRDFSVTVPAWRENGRQVLPRAPLETVSEIAVVDGKGARNVLDLGAIHIRHDAHRPAIVARGFALPTIPAGSRAEIAFRAGYADTWSELPGDLSFAVLSLAGALYEERAQPGQIPSGVKALIAPYRQPRLWGVF
ncbi:hypothetical protein [Palleronia sp.]|uniref:head-tail connector protein n=1 Tax=Palleronia sp. TaxID=1940284 RepID=UPI0035C836AD